MSSALEILKKARDGSSGATHPPALQRARVASGREPPPLMSSPRALPLQRPHRIPPLPAELASMVFGMVRDSVRRDVAELPWAVRSAVSLMRNAQPVPGVAVYAQTCREGFIRVTVGEKSARGLLTDSYEQDFAFIRAEFNEMIRRLSEGYKRTHVREHWNDGSRHLEVRFTPRLDRA
jgi:hypothetical protein